MTSIRPAAPPGARAPGRRGDAHGTAVRAHAVAAGLAAVAAMQSSQFWLVLRQDAQVGVVSGLANLLANMPCLVVSVSCANLVTHRLLIAPWLALVRHVRRPRLQPVA